MKETFIDVMREFRERLIDREHSPSLWAFMERFVAAHEFDIIKAQAEVMCKDGVPMERFNAVVKELSQVREELAKQCEYDHKLEADFSALMKDRNDLAEKNRACCTDNERLHAELERAIEAMDNMEE